MISCQFISNLIGVFLCAHKRTECGFRSPEQRPAQLEAVCERQLINGCRVERGDEKMSFKPHEKELVGGRSAQLFHF